MENLLDALHVYLQANQVALSELFRVDSFKIQKEWTSVFGRFTEGTRHKHGAKAVANWLAQTDQDLILMFLSSRIQAFPISENQRPCSAFEYAGPPVDVSKFHELEFAIFPKNSKLDVVLRIKLNT